MFLALLTIAAGVATLIIMHVKMARHEEYLKRAEVRRKV